MKPVKFKGHNCVYAENQPQYLPLPAYKDKDGDVTSCWQLGWIERLQVLLTGRIFWTQCTFGQPLQPQRASVTFEKS